MLLYGVGFPRFCLSTIITTQEITIVLPKSLTGQPKVSRGLFSKPQGGWLSKYTPTTLKALREEADTVTHRQAIDCSVNCPASLYFTAKTACGAPGDFFHFMLDKAIRIP